MVANALPLAGPPVPYKLRGLLMSLCEAAEAHESGLAHAPMSRIAHGLLDGRESRPLTALILGLTETSRRSALEALLSAGATRHPLCQVIIPPRVTFVEVQLHEQGFMVDDGRERRQFSDPEPFLQALESVDRMPESAMASITRPLRLTMAAAKGCEGIALLLPDTVHTLRLRAELLSLMTDRADLVLLCGEAESKLSPDDRDLLATLATGVPALQCVVTGGISGDITPAWSRGHTFSLCFPSTQAEPSLGGLQIFPALEPENRASLLNLRYLRDTETCLALLESAVQRELQLAAGKKRYQESMQISGTQTDDTRLRHAQEISQHAITSRLKAAQQQLDDRIRAWLSPNGPLSTQLTAALKDFTVADLHHEDEGEKTLLTLQPQFVDSLREKVHASTRDFITENAKAIQRAVGDTATAAAELLEPVTGEPVRLDVPPQDTDRLLMNVAPLFRTPIKFRGEVPRLTKGQMFVSIFQAPMIYGTAMMLLQAFNFLIAAKWAQTQTFQTIRYVASAVILPMVIVMPFYTARKIGRLRAAALRKELERVRDSAHNELERIASRALEDLKRHTAEYVNSASQTLAKDAERVLRSVGLSFQDNTKQRQRVSSTLIQGLDRQIRDLQGRKQTCDRLANDLRALRADALGQCSKMISSRHTKVLAS
jgi:hypothetical protein